MAIEAEMRRKTIVSIVAVRVFIALIVDIGAACSQNGLISTGRFTLIGAITTFVLAVASIDVWLSHSS